MTGGQPGVAKTEDEVVVAKLLGRWPRGHFDVVVRRANGAPMVIANAPLLDNGTPMPTRFWLVDPDLRIAIGRLEARGGVAEAEASVSEEEIRAAHHRYARERDAHIPEGHEGPVPTGGVGGTRAGVKCLHAHLAWWLAGGKDPVGSWVVEQLQHDRHLLPLLEVRQGPLR